MHSELDVVDDEVSIKVTIQGRNAFTVTAYELDVLVRESKVDETNYFKLIRSIQSGIKELYNRKLTLKQTEALYQKKNELEAELKKNGSQESVQLDSGEESVSSSDELKTEVWEEHPNISSPSPNPT